MIDKMITILGHLSASFPNIKAPIITPAMKADIVPWNINASYLLRENHLALIIHVAHKTPFRDYA